MRASSGPRRGKSPRRDRQGGGVQATKRWGDVATALQRGGPLTIKRADMHMRRLRCVGSLQSAATMLYIAEIISRSDWTVINGILPRCFNAVTPRATDNFSRVPVRRYTIWDFARDRRSCSVRGKTSNVARGSVHCAPAALFRVDSLPRAYLFFSCAR